MVGGDCFAACDSDFDESDADFSGLVPKNGAAVKIGLRNRDDLHEPARYLDFLKEFDSGGSGDDHVSFSSSAEPATKRQRR